MSQDENRTRGSSTIGSSTDKMIAKLCTSNNQNFKGEWVEMRRGDGYEGKWRSRDSERNANYFPVLPGTT